MTSATPSRAEQFAILRAAQVAKSDDVSGGVRKAILRAMHDHTGARGECWASLATLARETCFGRRTVARAVATLVADGYITTQCTRGRTASYRICWERLQGNHTGDDTLALLDRQDQCQSGTSDTLAPVPVRHTTSATVSATSATMAHKTNETNKQPKRARKRVSPSYRPEDQELPEQLDTEAFCSIWGEWCEHRREIRKPLTPTATRQQLRELAAMGERRATEAIRHTIARGWQGIREPEHHSGSGVAPASPKPHPALSQRRARA